MCCCLASFLVCCLRVYCRSAAALHVHTLHAHTSLCRRARVWAPCVAVSHVYVRAAEEEEAEVTESEYVPPSWDTDESMSHEQWEELFDNSDNKSFEGF